jgi:hypothetical protein
LKNSTIHALHKKHPHDQQPVDEKNSPTTNRDNIVTIDEWIDTTDVMEMLHVSRKTVQRWRTSGKIWYSKVGKKIYYRREDVDGMLVEYRRRAA